MKVLLLPGVMTLVLSTSAMAMTEDCAPDAVAQKYAHVLAADQDGRAAFIALQHNEPGFQSKSEMLITEILTKDADNRRKIRAIVESCGVQIDSAHGKANIEAILIIATHAPLDFQEEFFETLRSAAALGLTSSRGYAAYLTRMEQARARGKK